MDLSVERQERAKIRSYRVLNLWMKDTHDWVCQGDAVSWRPWAGLTLRLGGPLEVEAWHDRRNEGKCLEVGEILHEELVSGMLH